MMRNRLPRPKAFLLVLLAGLLVAASTLPVHASGNVISIAQARSRPLGSTVTVFGAVSTPSGAFESSFFDKGFGLQDFTGGIFVGTQVNVGLNPRAVAKVTGTLTEVFGLLVLATSDPSQIQGRSGGLPVLPLWVRTAAVSESTEGKIVKVIGHISQAPTSDLPFGYKFYVDDGSGEVVIFVNLQTGIDVSTLHLGQFVSVTGFSSQFDDHYEIDPRSPADIRTPF